MNTTTDHRLSDSDLTVLVERGAQGSWDSQLGPASGTMWDDVPHATKNSYREQVLSVIFHSTKALHELGYRKPRIITTVEELSRLMEGTVILDSEPVPCERIGGRWYMAADSAGYSDHKISLPATLLYEPEAAA